MKLQTNLHPDPIVNKLHHLIGEINALQTELRRESHAGCACGDGHCCAMHAYTFQMLDEAHKLVDRATTDLRHQQ